MCLGYINARGAITMRKRINITLPAGTLRLIDDVAEKGNRSRFIDAAVRQYIDKVGKENLRKRLKEGAIKRAERDLALASEKFALDE